MLTRNVGCTRPKWFFPKSMVQLTITLALTFAKVSEYSIQWALTVTLGLACGNFLTFMVSKVISIY